MVLDKVFATGEGKTLSMNNPGDSHGFSEKIQAWWDSR